jgi:hypothetical protein
VVVPDTAPLVPDAVALKATKTSPGTVLELVVQFAT